VGVSGKEIASYQDFYGAREENRTPDLRITSALLYRLSYPGWASPRYWLTPMASFWRDPEDDLCQPNEVMASRRPASRH
jgi:hypothetical protein